MTTSGESKDRSARLAELVSANKQVIMKRWAQELTRRLSLDLDESQLMDDLPDFLDEITTALRTDPADWTPLQSTRRHGRQRMQIGVDIAGLTEEITLVGETILALAQEDDEAIPGHDTRLLMRIIGRGTSASVQEYVGLRDRQLADQAARHFSFIAHEIRSPLNTARMAGTALARNPDKTTVHAKRLDRALSQLSELVDDFLHRARIYGQQDLVLEQVAASELVESACGDALPLAEAQEVELNPKVEDFQLSVDRKLIGSALTNLLTNAVKFTPSGGRVEIRAQVHADRALFEVEDQCGGMPEDLPSRLFRPFVQASNHRGGFGLGLMIVKQAVEAHRGAVRVVNSPGHGCCFVADLPRNQAQE